MRRIFQQFDGGAIIGEAYDSVDPTKRLGWIRLADNWNKGPSKRDVYALQIGYQEVFIENKQYITLGKTDRCDYPIVISTGATGWVKNKLKLSKAWNVLSRQGRYEHWKKIQISTIIYFPTMDRVCGLEVGKSNNWIMLQGKSKDQKYLPNFLTKPGGITPGNILTGKVLTKDETYRKYTLHAVLEENYDENKINPYFDWMVKGDMIYIYEKIAIKSTHLKSDKEINGCGGYFPLKNNFIQCLNPGDIVRFLESPTLKEKEKLPKTFIQLKVQVEGRAENDRYNLKRSLRTSITTGWIAIKYYKKKVLVVFWRFLPGIEVFWPSCSMGATSNDSPNTIHN